MPSLAAALHPRRRRYERTRRRLAEEAIAGSGIEVGALHFPFPVPDHADVRFVDRMTTDELRAEYPELAGEPLVEVDVVDDGETLATIPDASQDFVVASHFLEHTEDPIGTLHAHLRVLRPGGRLLLALPDRRQGVDVRRAPTPFEHLVRDHEEGPERSRREHYREWAELVDLPLGNVAAEEVERHAAELERRRYSIHFHCWAPDELGAQLRRMDLPATITDERTNYHEFLLVLTRS